MKNLGFGLMRLPLLDGSDQKNFDKKQVCEMVDSFLAQGFTYFDTAYMYHDGYSERLVKEVLVQRHNRDSYLLATKLPTMMLKEVGDMERIFNEQLDRTGAEYFDYYLLHCLNKDNYATCNRLGAFDFVMQKKADGIVKKIGFSYHDNAELLDEILTAHPEMEFVQLQINYLDWEDNGVQSRKCYEVARKHGKDIIVMEPVKGGKLADLPKSAEDLLKEKEPGLSAASWAVRFAASCEGVIMVLSGMSNMQQLTDNTSYMSDFRQLTDEEKKLCFKAADIINSAGSVPCTACRYCVEGCPMNIPIPEYFSLFNGERNDEAKAKYAGLAEKGSKASDCIVCGQCEGHCPQHIKIIERLKDVAAALE
ncbi:MAG: aldo/keto reductase [Oscillospiraceae bacterium]|nr:aldo/keto reductase [Oscillospiraceae bacterium]